MFPDVRLVSRRGSEIEIALDIELKSWYLLAKEGMPSLRLTVNPAACAPHDLVAVVPWYLSNVLSGVPTVLEPWVHGARAAAEHRNHWWTEVRVTTTEPGIVHPADPVYPYPNKADEVADKPVADRGGNFGRLARTGIMDDFLQAALSTSVAGIAADHWIKFFKIYSEPVDPRKIDRWLEPRMEQAFRTGTKEVGGQVLQLLREVGRLLEGD